MEFSLNDDFYHVAETSIFFHPLHADSSGVGTDVS